MREWIQVHLEHGPFAQAAANCYKTTGRLTLRLFIDGRVQSDGHAVLATVKIEGHVATGDQPEITVALVCCEETAGAPH